MNNSSIADHFTLLSKLMDIHGENSFKAKSYATAAFTIGKLPMQLNEIGKEKLASIKGIGDSAAKKVIELLETGALKVLNDLVEITPEGILEMLRIKGLGPKKIAVIWKEMEIETVGELLYACKENRLKLYKGFGEKTQLNVIETIEFFLKSKGSFLYQQAEALEESIFSFFKKLFPSCKINFAGAYPRHLETVDEIELVVSVPLDEIEKKMNTVTDFEWIEKNDESVLYKSTFGFKTRIHTAVESDFAFKVFSKNCSNGFLKAFLLTAPYVDFAICTSEEDIFKEAGITFLPAYLREEPSVIDIAKRNALPNLIQTPDIRGIIHSHSDWSDGNQPIEQMAMAAIEKKFEYLVISDHSKSAFYAGGLSEEKIKAQHHYIDELNKRFAPFKIFKSIESDILYDGSLDYSNAVLSTFDLVIASVHSNLKMNEEKAMMRLMNAIENPYTTILGHLTGRLLLSRKGYPVDHKKIIDACAANKVVIELNANPSRLDIDWRHLHYALEKNVLISINPDAHDISGFDHIRYGVLVAQKALVTKTQNLSSFGLKEMEIFIEEMKKKR